MPVDINGDGLTRPEGFRQRKLYNIRMVIIQMVIGHGLAIDRKGQILVADTLLFSQEISIHITGFQALAGVGAFAGRKSIGPDMEDEGKQGIGALVGVGQGQCSVKQLGGIIQRGLDGINLCRRGFRKLTAGGNAQGKSEQKEE